MPAKPRKPTAAKPARAAVAATAAPAAAAAVPQHLAGRAAARLQGSLDRVDPDGMLEGWCWSPDEPMAQRAAAVLIDGVEAARLMCDQERGDLVSAGIGKGRHAFRFRLDQAAMSPGQRVTVTLRDLRTGQQVGGAVTVQWPEAPPSAEPGAKPGELPKLYGHLDRVSRDGWVSGWCWYPDMPDEHVDVAVLVDGEQVGTLRAEGFRPDLQQAGIGDGTHGFSFPLPYAALSDKGALRITVQEAGTGRNIADPVTVRLGRLAATEERILDLERQVKLLRGQVEELVHLGEVRDEERAARELFRTVAEFFADLAKNGTARGVAGGFGADGLAGAIEDVGARYAPVTLELPERLAATVVIAATAPFETLHRCLVALHEAGVDRSAEIVLLDDGGAGGSAALLPTVARNLRYVRIYGGTGLIEARNEAARASRAPLVLFLAPQARVLPGFLDEIEATFAREPDAGAVGGRLVREDGLIEHALLVASEERGVTDPAHLAPFDAPEHRFMRRADALSGQAFAVRREVLLGVGALSPLYTRFGYAAVDLCARLRAAGWQVLYQPLAIAAWPSHGAPDTDGDPPDLRLPDEEALRLRARLEHEGWPTDRASSRFAGHALVIDDGLPRPDRDAGSIATFEQMVLLRRLGWWVTFCPVHALTIDPTATELLARNGIEVAGPPQYVSVTQYLQAFGADLGLVQIYRYANVAMLLDRVRELAPEAKLIFATADLHFLREQRRAELAGKTLPEAAREEELRCMLASDATIVTNDHEYELLRRDVPPERLVLLRWIERPRPIVRPFADRHGLCFVGNYQHPPNLDGVEWFLREVFPRVRRQLPGVRLKLAGSGMPASLHELADEQVEILGWVADLADLFREVRLSVAPLRFGAGFKGKVATSLGYGVPVVGSSVSLEGTGLANGDGVLAADDADSFAAAVVRLHEDAALWQAQSARGVERVTALYSPEAALDIWRRMLMRLGRPVAP